MLDYLKFLTVVNTGKLVNFIIVKFKLGHGSTWPGHIALKIYPQILTRFFKTVRKNIIIIAGTNGKTTTAKLIKTVLTSQGQKVIHNDSGANLLNGILSAFILNTDFTGKVNCDDAILEVDEATLPLILSIFINEKYQAKLTVVVLNLFRDQLDRYGEVDNIARKWIEAISLIKRDFNLILNADDPQIAEIGFHSKYRKKYFGIHDPKLYCVTSDQASDNAYCLNCGTKLEYFGRYYSHIGNWYCPNCKRKKPDVEVHSKLTVLEGVYNQYNLLAAILTCEILGYSDSEINKSLIDFQPAFGRQEKFIFKNRNIKMILAKNPVSLNEAIRSLKINNKITAILALNDQIPDGLDISWIWDAEIEELIPLCKHIICTGDRFLDMAVRVKYGDFNVKHITTESNFEKAIEKGLELTSGDDPLIILPTYSAMLLMRLIISGKKIL